MNPQETQQVVARDEKWVPSTERVKISSTNVRLETTVQQKEEIFQVVIDVIKNSTCFKASTIIAEVPKIFMQQFWYTIKKVKDSLSYEFLLANKKCIVDAEVFRKILDICPRVKSEEFTEVQDDDATLTFLIDLGYKGLLHKENVNYLELIWKTLLSRLITGRRENQDVKLCHSFDSPKLEFVRIREDYQEYRLPIPDMMLNDAIKRSKSCQMLLKYSTGQIPPKKSRGKGLQGKKTKDTLMADVDVFEESDSELARKRTASRRVVKKKVTISIAKNIIFDPDVTLELEEDHQGVQSLTPKEQESANTMQALKESKKTSRRQPGIRGTSKGTGSIPGVPDESTVVSPTSSEGTGTKPGVPDEEKIYFDEDDKKKDDADDDKSIDLEMTDDEETDDEFVHGDEQVNNDEGEEMTNAKVEESGKGDAEISNVAKADAEKIEEIKGDVKKAELPPTSSSLFVSSGFSDQFLKLSSDTSLVGTVKDTTDDEINSLLDIKIQSKVPHIQSSYVLTIPVLVIYEPVLRVANLKKDVSELKKIDHSVKVLATLKSQVPIVPAPESSKIQKPTNDLKQESEKSASEIRKIKRKQAKKKKMLKYTIKSTNKAALKEYDQKSALYQTMHKNKSFNKNPPNHALYHALMKALIKDENAMDKGVADTVKNHERQHDDDDDDDDEDPSVGPNQGKKTKRRRTKESESSKKPSTTKETSKGKAPSKGSKMGKFASAKKPVKEPITEVAIDDAVNTAGEDVVHDDDQPQDIIEPKIYKTLNQDWFKQPPRPHTPDPE
ncbi:hypothetical protein Tco_0394290 [Tanacetum coccineum]